MSSDTPLLNQPLSPDMGAAVVEYLRAIVALPDRGVVAGQAVCSALLALYGDGQRQGPINDVDVFFNVTPRHKHQIDPQLRVYWDRLAGGGMDTIDIDNDVDHGVYGTNILPERDIVGVKRLGKLNLIEMGKPFTTEELVSEFDFNLVSVGVDLDTGKMGWSSEFTSFLNDPKLESRNNRAQRTFVRALKKSREMPWLPSDLKQLAQNLVRFQMQCISESRPRIDVYADKLLDQHDPDRTFPRYAELTYSEDLGNYYPSRLLRGYIAGQPWSGSHDHPWGLPSESQLLALRAACETDDLESVKTLIGQGVPLNYPMNREDHTPLEVAARHGASRVFREVLAHLRPRFDEPDFMCAMWMATERGHVGILDAAHEAGFDLTTAPQKKNPLMALAGYHGQLATVEWLQAKGVPLSTRGMDGKNLVEMATLAPGGVPVLRNLLDRMQKRGTWNEEWKERLTKFALERRNVAGLVELASRGAQMPLPSQIIRSHWGGDDLSPLFTLMQRMGQTLQGFNEDGNDLIHAIVKAGASLDLLSYCDDVNAYNAYGKTALCGAAILDRHAIGQILIERGADLRGDPNPFVAAAQKNNWGFCLRMVANGLVPDEATVAAMKGFKNLLNGMAPEDLLSIPAAHAWAALGDKDGLLRCFESGFDPAQLDGRGRSVAQVAMLHGQEECASMARSRAARSVAEDLLQEMAALVEAP